MLEQSPAQGRIGLDQGVETRARQDVEIGGNGRFDVCGAAFTIEKSHLTEEIALTKGGKVVTLVAIQTKEHVHAPAAKEVQLVALVPL